LPAKNTRHEGYPARAATVNVATLAEVGCSLTIR
jgi:hypothetical protein